VSLVKVPGNLRESTFQIALQDYPKPRYRQWSCYVSPDFPGLCIHHSVLSSPKYDYECWDISHVGSGMFVVAGCKSLEEAVAVARRLAEKMKEYGRSWEEPASEIHSLGLQVIREIVKR
jgi:TATA-box binding protein (TBP) (component of TFIID and TFIIIB)